MSYVYSLLCSVYCLICILHQSILAIFGIFKLLRKKLKLQLKFENSRQTLVKYILEIEIFQNRLFIKIDY